MRLKKFVLTTLAVLTAALFTVPAKNLSLPFEDVQVAYAADTYSGDWTYEIKSDGTVTLKSYSGAGGNLEIPSVLDGRKVTEIGDEVFKNNQSLKNVTIPSTITRIGYAAFMDTSALNCSIVLKNVESIGQEAFRNSGITAISLPSTLTYIGACAFAESDITSIKIPSSIETWGTSRSYNNIMSWGETISNQFKDCDKLIVAEIDSPTIPESAFYGCDNLTKVKIKKNTTRIEDYAFENCTKLQDITMNSNVTSIGREAFSYTGITKITLPSTLKYIGYKAFFNSNLTSIKIPASVKYWGDSYGHYSQFQNCDKLISVEIDSALIPQSAFYNCDMLSEIKIGDTTTEVADYAFADCTKLQHITMGSNVTSIGREAFSNTSIMEITLPSTLSYIGYKAFYNTNLIYVKIPASVESWGTGYNIGSQFMFCHKLISAEIDSAQIPQSAFSGCDGLSKVKIGENTTTIDHDAFENCKKLRDITIGSNVTSIGEASFYNCYSLKSIILPEKLIYLDSKCFAYTNIREIALPDKVTFGINIFLGTPLETVRVGYCKISDKDYRFQFNSKVKFEVIKGTDAESYAKAKGYSYTYLKEKPATAVAFHEKKYTMVFGDALRLFPELTPQNSTDSLTWSVSDDFVLSVDAEGKVTALCPGTAKVTVTTKSGKKATCTVNVVFEGETTPDSQSAKRKINLARVKGLSAQTYNGAAITPAVTLFFNPLKKMVENVDYTVSYKNNVDAGTATVTFKGIGNYTGTLKKTFKINSKNAASAKVTLSKTSYTYSGKACEPTAEVVFENKTLKKGTDYTLKYSNNIKAGTATVIVTFKGNYKGTIKKTFTINPKNAASAKVTLDKTSYTYTGKACEPAAEVVFENKTLKKGTDYTLKYSNNIKAGTATVTVTFKGNYKGTIKKTFKINPAK